MNMRKMICAFAACAGVALATAADEVAEAEKGESEKAPVAKAEASVGMDSMYITYGTIDGKDPIVRVNGFVTFLDWWYVGGEMLFDVTKDNGKRGGYGNRAGKYTTLDMQTGIAHEFDLGETLGRLGLDFYTTYEYIPRHKGSMDDTDYVDIELTLNDLWFEPRLWIERDLMADDGTYVLVEAGHTFALVGEGDDATLTFKPSVAQGFGDKKRTRGYDLAESHAGLMDTTIKGELEWKLSDSMKLAGYVAYSDYWFDRSLRHGAREHNGAWGGSCNRSYNFYGGVAMKFEF